MKINNKNIVIISSLVASSQAYGLTVYKDDVNRVEVSGAFLMDYWQPAHFLDHYFNTSRSTLGIAIERQLDNGWSTDVKFEWDTILNPPSNEFETQNGDKFRSRLGYITVNNEELGSLRVGKQYSAYHDVAGYMDNLIVFDPDATPLFSEGKDGGFLATARGDNLIVYRNSFDALNVSIQYGFNGVNNRYEQGLSREHNMALAVSYDFDFGLSLGATHMKNQVDGVSFGGLDAGDSQRLTTIAAKYGYKGFHISTALTDGKKAHETDLLYYRVTENTKTNLYADASAYDMYAHYYFDIGLRPYIYLSQVNFDDNSVNIDGERSIYSFGLSYHATPQLIVSGEVRKTEEDNLGVGQQSDTLSGMTILYTF